MRPALFVSDLHLSADRPHLVEAFARLCANEARDAQALYILGDLFDVWLGDDQMRETPASTVVDALRSLTDAGVRVGIVRGNRDFLLGERFARATGATLLPERSVVDLAGTPTLILHGDELCTDDRGYQRLRGITHDPTWQRRMLALPYGWRRGIARMLRRQSRKASAAKPEAIMDVTDDAVATAFRTHGVARMIHGHTHRPAHHALRVDDEARDRWVLADWYDRGSYLEVGADGVVPHDLG